MAKALSNDRIALAWTLEARQVGGGLMRDRCNLKDPTGASWEAFVGQV